MTVIILIDEAISATSFHKKSILNDHSHPSGRGSAPVLRAQAIH